MSADRRGMRISLARFWTDERGQDMIEYALLAAAVAVSAGATLPPVSTSVSTVFSKVTSLVAQIP